jgi:hypothetical protein
MKPKPVLLTALGAAAVFATTLAPSSLHGQAGADDALYTPVIAEVAKQQAQIIENQTKIDETLALIAEDLRIARIFAARSGGKAK